LISK
jgi:hypothetical protein